MPMTPRENRVIETALDSILAKSGGKPRLMVERSQGRPSRRLTESYGEDEAAPSYSLGSETKQSRIKRNVIQYIKEGNSFRPIGPVELVPHLEPGGYDVAMTQQGPLFTLRETKTDQLYLFKGSKMEAIITEIDKFWQLKPNFQKLGFLHNRGLMMYGPPGCGKSACIQQVSESMAAKGDVMFIAKGIGSVRECLKAFREVEPERRVVVCMEDLDECIGYSERDVLQLLDGQDTTDNVLYLGTTNYINKFPPRLLRPGRFDKKIEIGFPPVEGRRVYLQHKLKGIAEDAEIDRIAGATEGFSFGHLREFVIGSYAFGEPANEVIRRLRAVDYTELPTREGPLAVESILREARETTRRPVLRG